MARSYARERMVASVAITATAATGIAPGATTSAFAAGSITPQIDTSGNVARSGVIARAVAVLQARTTCFGRWRSRYETIWRTKVETVSAVFDPYGRRAVSS